MLGLIIVTVIVGGLIVRYYMLNGGVRSTTIDPKNKHIAVTGCDSGFGYLLTKDLLQKGARVFAGFLTKEGMRRMKADVSAEEWSRCTTSILDVTNEEDVNFFVSQIEGVLYNRREDLHALVNNAGIFIPGPAEWLSMNDYRRIFDVNVFGAIYTTLELLPALGRNKESKGRIVNMSSISATVHGPFLSAYSSSKAAIDMFSSCLRVETGRNISVHQIMPSGFRTPLLGMENMRSMIERLWDNVPAQVREDYGESYKEDYLKGWVEGVQKYSSDRLMDVVDVIENALFDVKPQKRYYVGKEAKALFIPMSFFPTGLQDFILATIRQVTMRAAGVKYEMEVNKKVLKKD